MVRKVAGRREVAHSTRHATLRAWRCLFLALCATALLLLSQPGQAKMAPAPEGVQAAFATAARHYNVPPQLLLALGYVESHWEQRDGTPGDDNGYGIMHLIDAPNGTLQRAAALTGLPLDAIKKYAPANINAGAALLSDMARNLSQKSRSRLESWYSAVEEYSGSAVPGVREEYAREVYRVVGEGASLTLISGEQISLIPSPVQNLPAPLAPRPNSDDYGPAVWVPADTNNYTVGRPYPPLNLIVIHDTEGSYTSAINWFQNPSSQVSAHYVIRSSDGQITQMVRDLNTAYHTGVWDYNVRAIGIEHEGYMNQTGWYTESMYQASSALARSIADKYGIPKDRTHIIGHSEIPNQSHRDPGPNWDWTHYMALVRRDSSFAAQVDNTDADFAPVPAQIDPTHNWWTYAGGYGGSNSYRTLSVASQQGSANSASWTAYLPSSGSYDLYAFVPYVDNGRADTANAHYVVNTADGVRDAYISQAAITNLGTGSWAQVGRYNFTSDQSAVVTLSDVTGEQGLNVWFDAVMWIPTAGNPPPLPSATATRTPTRTATRTSTRTPTRTPTSISTVPPPGPTDTAQPPPPLPTDTEVPAPPTDTPLPRPDWTPGPCNMLFYDLPDSSWAYSFISNLYCMRVVSGYPDGLFRPNGNSTRGQFTKVVVLASGWNLFDPVTPTFSDVPPGSTYYTYIETANLRGVLGGYADGTFLPNNPVSRAQAAKILVLASNWTPEYPRSPTFVDVLPDNWAYGYVQSEVSHNVIGGYADGTFRPGSPISRAQISKIVTLALSSGGMSGKPPMHGAAPPSPGTGSHK
ncbi:MAG: S-layer homology domain-containing protein [Chloroflexota bacterium]|nr:S-layer homology domain-containing protein [Chloroflexota bacterium]